MTFGSVFGRVLSPTFQPSSQAAVSSGITDPTDISNCLQWIDFSNADYLFTDAGTTKVSSDGQAIYQANDRSGNNFHAVQSVSGDRPLYKTGIQNSKSVARFDGGPACFLTTLSASAGSFTFFYAYNNAETLYGLTGDVHYLMDAQTGRFIMAGVTGDNNYAEVAWYDGAWHNIANAINGWQSLTYHLSSGGNGTIYRNGSSLGSDSYTEKAIGGTVAIGRHNSNNSGFLAGDIGEIIIYNKALTSGELAQVETYLNNKWAIY